MNRFPAEWEPCDAVWLAWPHNQQTWPGRFHDVPAAFARFAQAIAVSTPVKILATGTAAAQARKLLGAVHSIELVEIPTNDCWVRDYGPTFVFGESRQDREHDRGAVLAIDWRFNAWGGKYKPFGDDAAAGQRIAEAAGLFRIASDLTLEGGALETDGTGRLLIHPECVITPTRNPGWSKEAISQELHRFLGVTEIVWVDGGGVEGDDTDGHIDQIARFVDPQNVVAAVPAEGAAPDAFGEGLEDNCRQLSLWARQTSPEVCVHRLAMPPSRRIDGQVVPQSYCNFLRIGPDRMLVPTFACQPSDDHALGLLRDLCPGVDIQGVPCEDIAWGLGALHCASCSQPKSPWPQA